MIQNADFFLQIFFWMTNIVCKVLKVEIKKICYWNRPRQQIEPHPTQLTIPLNKLPCYDSSSNNCDVIRSLTPVGNDCQQGGQECSSQCTTTQEQECNTEYEQVCRNINEQVSTI